MIFGPRGESVRIYVRPGVTDMRKQANSLAVLVKQQLAMNPLAEATLFLFCNRQRRILKALYWDATGFCLWQLCEEKYYAKQTHKTVVRERVTGLLLKNTSHKIPPASVGYKWSSQTNKPLSWFHSGRSVSAVSGNTLSIAFRFISVSARAYISVDEISTCPRKSRM